MTYRELPIYCASCGEEIPRFFRRKHKGRFRCPECYSELTEGCIAPPPQKTVIEGLGAVRKKW